MYGQPPLPSLEEMSNCQKMINAAPGVAAGLAVGYIAGEYKGKEEGKRYGKMESDNEYYRKREAEKNT
eukprot:NODE_1600_length_432_cov_190.114754_g1590_i0.p1 GENE.NODE_1600_length_432_cov_190.114754_g1590_i0~~NODE_1600_length_432_cov_190.114754_g1590_i0.p1  ORF type:complete len:68 (+),score=17.45 NODE_1600_length_432_cov_190.114754_g1590_i0:64-267(+)